MEKIQALRKQKLKRTLTKREKNLLILLALVIISWIITRFIITPQYNKFQTLNLAKQEYENRIQQMNSMLEQEDIISRDLEKLKIEEFVLTNKYFSRLDQSEIISLLSDILDNEGFSVQDIIFEEPVKEQIGDLNIHRLDIDIPYNGNYQGLKDSLKGITSSPKKIIINCVIADKGEEDSIIGNISLRIYSLNNDDIDEGSVNIGEVSSNLKSDPFKPFDNYEDIIEEETVSDNIHNEIDITEEKYNMEILEDFEKGSFEFIPSSQHVTGDIYLSNKSKSNKSSLKLEFNILAIEDENKAFVDLSERNIVVKYPPSSSGLWVYSYGYSPVVLGIRLKGQNNEQIDITLSEGVSWTGWKFVEANMPSDLTLYPLKIDKIFIDLAYNRDDYGVLLFDRLEANYPENDNEPGESFVFHKVEKGETLNSICTKYYNTLNKKNVIMKLNELKTEEIDEGKILIIPR